MVYQHLRIIRTFGASVACDNRPFGIAVTRFLHFLQICLDSAETNSYTVPQLKYRHDRTFLDQAGALMRQPLALSSVPAAIPAAVRRNRRMPPIEPPGPWSE